ncbi:hypothetical protein EYR36_004519 [Pleurotus pulmonarius]|nr:hypothetical protein EYR36_004519 [Pleurotus pulmonarius]KAF4603611.1 hypothetical protein EYR38_004025 [Pleurotus pulmonarius]
MITPPAVAFKRPEAGPSKTLTPQRKHRKLLKDGSGTEVWPERIEKVFVQGLKEYWHSPFATYSRGRSRYRNQFLVEHLAKAGITRSKKQVASHIQVLRNMWKGEPEFHLVAGGEELADSTQLPPTKLDERAMDRHVLWSFDWNECDSSNTSPNYSPDVKHECSPSLLPRLSPGSASPPSLSSQDSSPNSIPSQLDVQYLSHGYPDFQIASPYAQPPFSDNAYHTSGLHDIPNQVTAFYLVASGSQPFAVNFDSNAHPLNPSDPCWEMKTKLSMTPFDGISVEPQGFTGSVMLASPFSSGTCITQVFSGQQRIHQEHGPLYPSPTDPLAAFLPADSPLAKCRSYYGITLLYAVHVLCRGEGYSTPSARLVAYRPHQDNNRRDSIARSVSQSPRPASTAYHTTAPYSTLYQPTTAPLTSSPSLSTTASTSYPLATAPVTSYPYSPPLSPHSTTPTHSSYTYGSPALSHPYPQPSSLTGYDGSSLYGSVSSGSIQSLRRSSLSQGHPLPNY